MTETATKLRLKDIIETQTCGRCGGTGQYSFNLMHGSMCYGCQGKKLKDTKRGAAAKYVKPGDRIFVQPGPFNGGGWTEVLEVSEETDSGHINLKTKGITLGEFPECKTLVSLADDPEFNQVILKRVAQYQGELTKQGKLKKACQ
jgi:hypothetical protein